MALRALRAPRVNLSIASMLLVVSSTLAITLTGACRRATPPAIGETIVEQFGEPDQYSATVVRTFDGASGSETRVTREGRSGEKRRLEWMEGDQNLALIWRPDLGKSYLLDLDKRLYREVQTGPGHIGGSDPAETYIGSGSAVGSKEPLSDSTLQALDHYFDETQSPAHVETRVLPATVIDGYSCKVYEQRTTFLDGHIEVTRRYRARDLEWLPLRMECETGAGGVRVTTERREVRLEVSADLFEVPADFRRVGSLH